MHTTESVVPGSKAAGYRGTCTRAVKTGASKCVPSYNIKTVITDRLKGVV
jgi:hypothetical protein